MGALTINRNKRDASSQSTPSSSCYNHQITKKIKSLHMGQIKDPRSSVSRSSVSRLSLYPKNITPIFREMHAPCRFISGFAAKLHRLFANSSKVIARKPVFSGDLKNALFSKCGQAKESEVRGCERVVIDEEDDVVEVIDVGEEEDDDDVEVIDVDDDDDIDDLGGSSVDVIDLVENERDQVMETDQIVAKYKELDQKGALELTDRKMLESGVDVSVPLHKKLQRESDEKHDISLRRLKFDIKFLEAKLALEQQARPAKKKEDVANDPFRPLTKEEEEMVVNALSYSNRNKVLVTHEDSNITITGEVLQCLRPRAWLNDEVINLYLELLKERETRKPKKFLKCHFFNTFFYKKLISGKTGYDYNSVRRWTAQKKLGYTLLECDKIFVPIHKEIHWCLAVINKKEEKFLYLDSLGGADKKVLRFLAKYITDEVKDKTGQNIDVSSWEQEFVTDLPNQENGYDCGMFMIKYADFYSRDIGLCFNQEDMPYFRRRTAKEILKLRAD